MQLAQSEYEDSPSAMDTLRGAAETLFIPVWARAKETCRSDGLIKDPHAVRIVGQLGFDFERFQQGWKSQLGVVLRTLLFDEVVRRHLEKHEHSTIINLGAGLDARFLRVDNGAVRWFDLDLAEVIALRQSFFVESERYRCLAFDLRDPAWPAAVTVQEPLLILAEGVSMYLNEAENRTLLNLLTERFAPAELLMDFMSPWLARNTARHDLVSKTSAQFRFGLAHAGLLEEWSSHIHRLAEWQYLIGHPERWGYYRLLHWLPPVRRMAWAAHFRLTA